MSRPRMVFLHSSDELYGADRMLVEMVAAVPQGVSPEVWLPTDLPHPQNPLCVELERRGVVVRHAPLPVLRRAYLSPVGLARLSGRSAWLATRLAADRPAAVYCTTSAMFPCAPVARAVGVRRVFGHVQEIWSGSDRQLLGPLAAACHRLITISAAVSQALPATVARKATVVLNGTPEPALVTGLEGRSGGLVFVVASRWNGWKGHRTLLSAWDRAGSPGTLLVLGGLPPSGESTDVEALVSTLSDPSTVDIRGELPDPSAVFNEADVLVVPSDSPEPFGLIAIEAFARARPVIASRAGGLAEIVTDGHDGWTFPPRDVPALADLLRGLSRQMVARAGSQARQTYLERFTAARFAKSWQTAVFR